MTEKSIRPAFTAKAGELEMEIFLLSDSARQELHAIQAENNRQQQQLQEEHSKRRPKEVHEAWLQANTERVEPKLRPPWPTRHERKTQAERQAIAEHKVDRRHAAEIVALNQRHRQQQDEFLTRQRHDRLLREAIAKEARIKARAPIPLLKRDFDRSR